jgi:hypothetical protein
VAAAAVVVIIIAAHHSPGLISGFLAGKQSLRTRISMTTHHNHLTSILNVNIERPDNGNVLIA